MEKLVNIRLSDGCDSLIIIDQTLLPNELRYVELQSREQLFEAIRRLQVRGAPAIGIAAAYGYYLCARTDASKLDFFARMDEAERYLASARPTAVNLSWALGKMRSVLKRNALLPRTEIVERLKKEAFRIHEEDKAANRSISEYGLSLIKDGDGVLTHCNAGPLATSEYGTALGPLLMSAERGMHIRVFADETRPLLQGSRLTAYELMHGGVDTTLICDSMASIVMKNGWVNAVFVGCDRAAANGDCANKVGTSGLAVLAHHYGIPFYVFAPLSTVDMSTAEGIDIKIELRDAKEITELHFARAMAPAGVKVYNPSFDVTDNSLIAGIVTDVGIIVPPFEENLKKAFERKLADHVDV